MSIFGQTGVVNIPFSAMIWGVRKSASAGRLRLLFFIKKKLTNDRGEFCCNRTRIAELTGCSRPYVSKAIAELQGLGLIVIDDHGKYRVVSNFKINRILLKEIGGMETYRNRSSQNKVCKIPVGLLENPDKVGFRGVLDLALLMEEERSQVKAIQFREKRRLVNHHLERGKNGDLLSSDSDSSASIPVLSCEGLGKRSQIHGSTACRRMTKLQVMGFIERKKREIVISASAPGYRPPEVIDAFRKGASNFFYSKRRNAYVRPLASSFSVVNGLGIEWVRRSMT